MQEREAVDLQEIVNSNQLIANFVSGRRLEISLPKKVMEGDSSGPTLIFKTHYPSKSGYISITVRKLLDVDSIVETIEDRYGGLVLPLYPRLSILSSVGKHQLTSSTKKADVPKQEEYDSESDEDNELFLVDKLADYFNKLLKHKRINHDQDLFKFLFIQQAVLPTNKSKYKVILNKLLDFSREYLNKLLTREDEQQISQQNNRQLQIYRESINLKSRQFGCLAKILDQSSNEIQILYTIETCFKNRVHPTHLISRQPSQLLIIRRQAQLLKQKYRKLRVFIQQLKQPFSRRQLLRQEIKQLKAQAIRSIYDRKYGVVEKELQFVRHKYQVWTEDLLRQLECNQKLLDSLMKELAAGVQRLKAQIFFYSPVDHDQTTVAQQQAKVTHTSNQDQQINTGTRPQQYRAGRIGQNFQQTENLT